MGFSIASHFLPSLGSPRGAERRLCVSSLGCLLRRGPLALSAPRLRHVPGASRMRWPYQQPRAAVETAAAAAAAADWREWVRRPLISPETGEPIDWLYGTPKSGYEPLSVYGQETVLVEGLPMGRTPEFLQERLWRYFSKFGIVQTVHVLPHKLDPYQTCGTAYVSFEEREAALKAVRLPVRLPASLHFKVLRLRHIATGRCSDDLYIHRKLHANRNIVFLARQMYLALIRENKPLSLSRLRRLVFVRGFCGDRSIPYTPGAWREAQGCVSLLFGTWRHFLSAEPFNELFFVLPSEETTNSAAVSSGAAAAREQQQLMLAPRLIAPEQLDVLLRRGSRLLHRKLEAELSVHWREGKPRLPDETKRQIDLWLHKEPLPEELQTWSRSKDAYKIHDERHLFKLRLRKERKKAELQRRLQRAAAQRASEQQQQQQRS